jgi:hypothetical protein
MGYSIFGKYRKQIKLDWENISVLKFGRKEEKKNTKKIYL